MRLCGSVFFAVLLGSAAGLWAQSPDSARVPSRIDTVRVSDSTNVLADTLSEAQKAQQRFEERYRTMKAAEAKPPNPFSYDDSLIAYFVSPRLNERADRERSYRFNAADYVRFDPSLVQMRYQPTPLRQTMQPFGLSGSRMSVLAGSESLTPFEHLVEPDGQLDGNDLPMTLSDEVYLLPGPLGTLFGETQSIATYMDRPATLTDNNTHTAFIVDKGWGGLSNARGRYSRNFASGKLINMAVAYRQGTGFQASDKSYHYDGNFTLPIREQLSVKVDGHLYDRRGEYVVWPDIVGRYVQRHRYDRTLAVSLVKSNDAATMHNEVGYRYLRQGSELGRDYTAQDHLVGHRLFASRDWVHGATLGKFEIVGDAFKYDNGSAEFSRLTGAATFRLAHIGQGTRWGIVLGQKYVESTRWLPMATAVWERQSEKGLLIASVGYNEREPSLLELHLPARLGMIYSAAIDYADSGNSALVPERQLIGSLTAELGHTDQAWRVSVTGGTIIDGIDWDYQTANVRNNAVTLFRPYNGNLSFVTVSSIKKFRFSDLLRISGGGSYHFVDYAEIPDHAYTPEYQAFSNAELHVPWRRKLVDLYGAADLTYLGPYRGYSGREIGNQVVLTGRLGFTMGRFQFHYLFHNLLNSIVEEREFYSYQGRYYTWGFVWNFLN
jgi:hypothetical protein